MKMFADYISEREGKDCYWDEKGFIVWKIKGDECYIETIYVKPEFRREKHAFKLGDHVAEIARKNGCKFLTGSVASETDGASESMAGQLAYGFKLFSPGFIILKKEL